MMAEQLSLFGAPVQGSAPSGEESAAAAPAAPGVPVAVTPVASEPVACYASVIVDIPARALSEPFAYAVPGSLADELEPGSTVLVTFGRRNALGYVAVLARDLADLPGADGLDPARVKPLESVLARPRCAPWAGEVAFWMSREYVAPLAECLRLFLPPGGTPRLVRASDGTLSLHYTVRADHPNPWHRNPVFWDWLWAEDDLGNTYSSYGQVVPFQSSAVRSSGTSTTSHPFVSYYSMWVDRLDPAAEKLTLRFDRYGENAIDLTLSLKGGT